MPSIKWTDGSGLDKLLSVFLFYLILLVALHTPFLFYHQSLFLADLTYNLEPVCRFISQYHRFTGAAPLWNPYIMAGVPQIQAVWPISYFPLKLFLYVPFPIGLSIFLLVHQLVAGMGGFIWLYYGSDNQDQPRRFSMAVLFGMMFMLCGYMTGSAINPFLVAAACWIPLLLFITEQLLVSPGLWSTTAFGLIAGLQMSAGRPELVALSVVLCLCYLLYRGWTQFGIYGLRSAGFGKSAIAFVLGLFLAAGYAAVNILPMLDLVAFEPKIGSLVTLGLSDWSTRWFDFLGIMLSQPFGFLNMSKYQLNLSSPGQMPYITSLYLGAPVLVLAVVGFFSRQWKQRWFWLCWTVVSLAVAAGALAPMLGYLAPDLLVFRYPIKAAVMVLLGLCLAAVYGWRAFLNGEVNARTAAGLCCLTAAVFLSGVVLALVPKSQFDICLSALGVSLSGTTGDALLECRRLPWELIAAGSSGFLLAFLCLPSRLSLLGPGLTVGVRAFWLLVIAVLLEINGASNLWHTVDADFFDEPSDIVDRLLRSNLHDRQTFRVLSLVDDPLLVPPVVSGVSGSLMDGAFMRYSRRILKPNTNMDFGIQLINGMTTIPNWSRYFLDTGLLPRSSLYRQLTHPAGKSDLPLYRWCQASSTNYVITSRQSADDDAQTTLPYLDKRWFHLIDDSPMLNIRLYEIDKVRPRWSLQDRYQIMPDRYTALSVINRCDRTGYDPMKMVLINAGAKIPPDLQPSGSAGVALMPGEPPGTIDFVSEDRHCTTVMATMKVPAFLVVSDSYYPWWSARDNGKLSKIYLADGLYRAVRVQAGKHKITFSYSPTSLLWGILIHRIAVIFISFISFLAVLHVLAKKIRIQ